MHLSGFIHQKSYEKIVAEVRRHSITIVPATIGFLFLLSIPLAAWWFIQHLFPDLLTSTVLSVLLIFGASVYCLSVALFFYSYFVTFYLDLLVVTNDRLLEIDQQGLFARTISELDLYKIQDITSEVKGVFASIFNYGNLTIQTAAATEKFMVHNVPSPDHLRQMILDLAEEDRKFHSTGASV